MAADLSSLVRLEKFQIEPAAETLARAFQDYPVNKYDFPDDSERRDKLPYLFQFHVRNGILDGEVHATSLNMEGIAVWQRYPTDDSAAPQTIHSRWLALAPKIGKDALDRESYFGGYVGAMHRRLAPVRHWSLGLIGILPEFQGKGYASMLLKPMLARIDEEHLPCYLHTEDEKNVAIYQRYGFKVVEDVIIPDIDIRSWAMLREKSS